MLATFTIACLPDGATKHNHSPSSLLRTDIMLTPRGRMGRFRTTSALLVPCVEMPITLSTIELRITFDAVIIPTLRAWNHSAVVGLLRGSYQWHSTVVAARIVNFILIILLTTLRTLSHINRLPRYGRQRPALLVPCDEARFLATLPPVWTIPLWVHRPEPVAWHHSAVG